jgi:hypothetical protein
MLNILIGKYIFNPYQINSSTKVLEDETETIKKCFVFLFREARKHSINSVVCIVYSYNMLKHSHLSDIFGEKDLKLCKEKNTPLKLNVDGYEINLYFESDETLAKNIQNYAGSIFFTPYDAAESIKKIEKLLPKNSILYSLEFYENDIRKKLNSNEYVTIKI